MGVAMDLGVIGGAILMDVLAGAVMAATGATGLAGEVGAASQISGSFAQTFWELGGCSR